MNLPDMQPAAVLTGDLIGSTLAAAQVTEQALATLAQAARLIATWTRADPRLTRFRGDGWQMVLTRKPELALRAALHLAAALQAQRSGLATRIAIGLGHYSSLGTQDLSDARGDAFTQSGRTLDKMPKVGQLAVAGPSFTDLHSGFLKLVEAILQRWTPEQAEAMSHYLHPGDPILDDIAQRLGITIQAVSYRVRGANGQVLRQALKNWEASFLPPADRKS